MPSIQTLEHLGATATCLLLLLAPPLSVQEFKRYSVNPGDILQVSVWREPDLQLQLLVRSDSGIPMPLVGDLGVHGMSVDDIRAAIATGLERFIPDPAAVRDEEPVTETATSNALFLGLSYTSDRRSLSR